MLRVVTVSSSFERGNAERLAVLVRAAWPGIESSQTDAVTIAAGLKLVRESDLLVTFAFERPRPMGPVTLRDGSVWKGGEPQAGAIIIECKALDASRLTSVGNDLRPIYGGGRREATVLEQLKSQVDGLVQELNRYGIDRCFIHGLAWMTGVSDADLQGQAPGLSPFILGSDVTWEQMVAAAALENAVIAEPAGAAYRGAVGFVTERFTRDRKLSARDLAKLDKFTTGVLARDVLDDVMEQLGKRQIRLVGRAGSGKSATLALVAARVVERDQARVLFLTYHKVLSGELDHLVRAIAGSSVPAGQVVVVTMHHFLVDLYLELGGSIPLVDGKTDWHALPHAVEAFIRERGAEALTRDAATLRTLRPDRFDFDYVFIDEGQDWQQAERDLLRLLFQPEQTMISDGRDQFAQRQTRCDWTSDVDKPLRYMREMKRSLRMSANVGAFVTALAGAMGFHDWRVQPHPELTGGRVILARDVTHADLIARVLDIAHDSGVSPGDCLVAVPPKLVDGTEDGKRARVASELAERGIATWDATDDRGKLSQRQPDEVAIVPYASLRGLEGWATVLLDLDAWDDNRQRYPNTEADEPTTADEVAKRALLLALTRAAHVLVITTNDPSSRVAAWLEEASKDVGNAEIIERW